MKGCPGPAFQKVAGLHLQSSLVESRL
jgi:hypothetical protein